MADDNVDGDLEATATEPLVQSPAPAKKNKKSKPPIDPRDDPKKMDYYTKWVDSHYVRSYVDTKRKYVKQKVQRWWDAVRPSTVLGLFVDNLPFNAHRNSGKLQLTVFLIALGCTVWPLICFLVYKDDIHIRFWLGEIPLYVCLMVPCVIFLPNVGLTLFQSQHCCADEKNPGYQCCSIRTAAAQKVVLIFWGLVAVACIGGGGFVLHQAGEVTSNLVQHCGQDPQTAAMEDEWQNLDEFYDKCAPKRNKPITRCSGYSGRIKDKAIAEYLEDIEEEFECAGFCKFWAKPLYQEQTEIEPGARCASELGFHVAAAGHNIGFPIVLVGLCYLCVGLLFATYDSL